MVALAATLGLTTYLFQDLLGYDELTYYVPFAAAVLLVSLGSDYNVFVAGEIGREADRRPMREAVAIAAPRASRAIAVAGIVLAASFATLAIVPLRAFHELAFALAVGVLVDAFVVRSLLVPGLISFIGRVSFWPGAAPLRPPGRRMTFPRGRTSTHLTGGRAAATAVGQRASSGSSSRPSAGASSARWTPGGASIIDSRRQRTSSPAMTATEPPIGIAASAPSTPASSAPMSTDARIASGESCTLRPYTSGCRTWFSNCW